MILVDTSVWVDHFRHSDTLLEELLTAGRAVTHPFIIGELACGNLKQRVVILDLLQSLPQVQAARHEEVLHLVDVKALYGKGLGWIDAHLLASALLSRAGFWTRDRRLAAAARALHVAEQE